MSLLDQDNTLLPFEDPKKITTKSDDELILDVIEGKIEKAKLSVKVQEYWSRLRQCRDWIRDPEMPSSRFDLAPMLMNEYGVSEVTAYRIYEATIRVYNAVSSTEGRDFWIDNHIRDLNRMIQKCERLKDFKTVEKLLKQRKEIYSEFFGTNDAKIYEDLQPPITITEFIRNENLPEDWEKQADRIINRKSKANYEDAESVEFTEDLLKDEIGKEDD